MIFAITKEFAQAIMKDKECLEKLEQCKTSIDVFILLSEFAKAKGFSVKELNLKKPSRLNQLKHSSIRKRAIRRG
jgi:hypothetical protein